MSVDAISGVDVSSLLPQIFEDVGYFKKKISKGPLRTRPPSSQGNTRPGSISIMTEDVDMRFNPKPNIELTDRSQTGATDRETAGTRLGPGDTVDLTALSQSLQNSLANLLHTKQAPAPKPPKEDLMKALGRKLSFKKKAMADAVASQEASIDSGSNKSSAQNSEKKPRLRPLKAINLPNGPVRPKAGEDVFLMSIFGSKNKNTGDSAQSVEHSVDRGSEGSANLDKKGANGARMRFVRNILVPVSLLNQKSNASEKKFDIDMSTNSKELEGSEKSSKRELSKILRNVENRNILINKKGNSGQISVASNPNRSYQASNSNKSAGRSPVKIMKMVVPESVVADTEKKKHYKLRASVESDQKSLNPMDSGFLLKKHNSVDLNKTMPNLKDALENELRQKDNNLMKTGTSINSDADEVF